MLLYVEQTRVISRSYGGARREVLVDTASTLENEKLERKLDVRSGQEEASMLFLEVGSPAWACMREGVWYNVPDEVLVEATYEIIEPESPGGGIVRARLIFSLSTSIDFSQYRAEAHYASIPSDEPPHQIGMPLGDDLELVVIDCGQGNWNEIRSKTDVLIYDMGASLAFTQSEVKALVRRRGLDAENRNVNLILSHWDVDHYRAILELTGNDLKSMQSVTVPDQVPATATYRRCSCHLSCHYVSINAIKSAQRLPGTGRKIVLSLCLQAGALQLYRAVPGRSRNQTGIVIAVLGTRRTALLTGDHHYEKIFAAISPHLLQKPAVLVAPHHGGFAGTISLGKWQSFSSIEAVISVGRNSYGHPLKSVVNNLTRLQGVPPARTDLTGDLRYML